MSQEEEVLEGMLSKEGAVAGGEDGLKELKMQQSVSTKVQRKRKHFILKSSSSSQREVELTRESKSRYDSDPLLNRGYFKGDPLKFNSFSSLYILLLSKA